MTNPSTKSGYQRNPVARAAILRKGGVHEKCSTAKRQQQKRELERIVSDYLTEDKTVTFGDRFWFLLAQILTMRISNFSR